MSLAAIGVVAGSAAYVRYPSAVHDQLASAHAPATNVAAVAVDSRVDQAQRTANLAVERSSGAIGRAVEQAILGEPGGSAATAATALSTASARAVIAAAQAKALIAARLEVAATVANLSSSDANIVAPAATASAQLEARNTSAAFILSGESGLLVQSEAAIALLAGPFAAAQVYDEKHHPSITPVEPLFQRPGTEAVASSG